MTSRLPHRFAKSARGALIFGARAVKAHVASHARERTKQPKRRRRIGNMSVRVEERKSVKGGVGGKREWNSTRCGVQPPLHQTAGAQLSVACTKLYQAR